MFYEIKLKTEKETSTGKVKQVAEHFIVDCEMFAEAEYAGMNEYNGQSDVFAITRSKIREIVNQKEEGKPFYKATLTDVFVNEDGTEKEMQYPVLVCAEDLNDAGKKMDEYMKMGMGNLRLDSIVKTKIVGVL